MRSYGCRIERAGRRKVGREMAEVIAAADKGRRHGRALSLAHTARPVPHRQAHVRPVRPVRSRGVGKQALEQGDLPGLENNRHGLVFVDLKRDFLTTRQVAVLGVGFDMLDLVLQMGPWKVVHADVFREDIGQCDPPGHQFKRIQSPVFGQGCSTLNT